jgi:hypothetical protein
VGLETRTQRIHLSTRGHRDAVLIVDGTLVFTRDHWVAEHSEHYRYSWSPPAGPLPGNDNACTAWELSGAKDSVGNTTVIAWSA